MSTWIGKDINNVVRAQLNYQPPADHLGLSWEEVAIYKNPDKKHLIRSLAVSATKDKMIYAINYKTELKRGIRLMPEFQLTNDGLLKETIYFLVDETDNSKRPVIKVTEVYTYAEAEIELNPSERGIRSRTKTWQYYFEDRTLDESEENTNVKVKLYNTNRLILEIGGKRRTNITRVLSEKCAAILVLLGVFQDDVNGPAKLKAYDALRNLSRQYSTDFTEFKLYATTELYDSILTDSVFNWLATYIPTKNEMIASGKTAEEATTYQGYIDSLALKDMQGKDLRTYFIEKLKGLVS